MNRIAFKNRKEDEREESKEEERRDIVKELMIGNTKKKNDYKRGYSKEVMV